MRQKSKLTSMRLMSLGNSKVTFINRTPPLSHPKPRHSQLCDKCLFVYLITQQDNLI